MLLPGHAGSRPGLESGLILDTVRDIRSPDRGNLGSRERVGRAISSTDLGNLGVPIGSCTSASAPMPSHRSRLWACLGVPRRPWPRPVATIELPAHVWPLGRSQGKTTTRPGWCLFHTTGAHLRRLKPPKSPAGATARAATSRFVSGASKANQVIPCPSCLDDGRFFRNKSPSNQHES